MMKTKIWIFFHFRKFMHNQSKAKEIVIFNDKIITEIISSARNQFESLGYYWRVYRQKNQIFFMEENWYAKLKIGNWLV